VNRRNWSIDDVSARLKVSSAKLRALESGDISQLPDTTFALGVVRSYAKMLGADPRRSRRRCVARKACLRTGSVDAGVVGQGFAARQGIAVARR
jgi:hypothetical protein